MDEVKICNMALSHIGEDTIAALTERSQAAIQCNIFYDTAIKATLEASDWNFARKRETLALLADTPPAVWTHAYAYPSDCVSLRRIEHTVRNPRYPHKFEIGLRDDESAKAIYCDVSGANAVYTKHIKDERLFSASFVIAMSYKLAELVAMPITRQPQQMQLMAQQFSLKISAAEADDMNEAEPDEQPESAFLKARK